MIIYYANFPFNNFNQIAFVWTYLFIRRLSATTRPVTGFRVFPMMNHRTFLQTANGELCLPPL